MGNFLTHAIIGVTLFSGVTLFGSWAQSITHYNNCTKLGVVVIQGKVFNCTLKETNEPHL